MGFVGRYRRLFWIKDLFTPKYLVLCIANPGFYIFKHTLVKPVLSTLVVEVCQTECLEQQRHSVKTLSANVPVPTSLTTISATSVSKAFITLFHKQTFSDALAVDDFCLESLWQKKTFLIMINFSFFHNTFNSIHVYFHLQRFFIFLSSCW